MPPATLNLTRTRAIMQGDPYTLEVSVWGSHFEGVDLATYTFAAALRDGFPATDSFGDPLDPAAEFTATVDADVGSAEVVFTLTAEQTAALDHRAHYVWDCEVVDPDGDPLTLIRGTQITVLPQVTVNEGGT